MTEAAAEPPAVDAFLAALESRLRAEIERAPVAAPARQLLEAGGKRLRARLVWWSACATAPTPPKPTDEPLVRAAAAIELAHLGSLVHDDIADGGDTRRGVPTVHRTHGVELATDAGAALAHLSNGLVAPLGPPARRAVRRAILATCRGQVRELAIPFVPVPPRMRLAIMREKTGAFFELAAALGASVVGAPPVARAAATRFARRFGVAFQIADDILDLAGDPEELGRDNGADLRDGVLTLPVLLALEREPSVRTALAQVRHAPNADVLATCADLVIRADGVTAAADAAAWWLARALHALAPLAPSPARAALAGLARTSIARGVRLGAPRFTTTANQGLVPQVAHPFVFETVPESGSQAQLTTRLRRLLDWVHPGLAVLVAIRMNDPAVRAHHQWARDLLVGDRAASAEAQTAADALGLAYALSDPYALAIDPVRTLALVDALHCAGIGLLNETGDAVEHATIAERARHLHGRRPQPLATSSPLRAPAPLASPSPAPVA